MKLYCLISDPTTSSPKILEGPCLLPRASANISNLHLLDESALQLLGWLPLEQWSENKEIRCSVSYEILKDKVIEKIETRDKTEEELANDVIAKKTRERMELQYKRDQLLKASDILVLPDRLEKLTEEEKQKIFKYRQDLRDLPASATEPATAVFPTL